MNREIKFRIWDRQANRWAENDCSLHCCSNWQIDPFTGQLTDFVSALDSDEVTRYNADPAPDYYWKDGKIVNEPRYVLVQYTGLKDKNGVEIYEGDILKIQGYRGAVHHVQVKWESVDASDDMGMDMIGFPRYSQYGEPEVVGNIFENPELLKQ